ncbi:uncharacterized protein TRAVEDRAFT_51986 [Trametes versicolor FP-101664 SS1]|uniref:uncharacterized protein n=1 Tax=Trametes versicolor (strain FP-101664) TaxID=717944 RepID=UPI000462382B|nr:uncharacterized protein TRAVEDRAFT_51986 [Trametes versicolor FP-101664 SS1]EIW54275.1 hypothetical protein TRAVEDRAFT_51986 [Trametes versicolor FP-101664 SS1]
MNPEQILAKLQKKWCSDIYKHFEEPHIIYGQMVHLSKHIDCIDYEESTSNLTCHHGLCDPDDILLRSVRTSALNSGIPVLQTSYSKFLRSGPPISGISALQNSKISCSFPSVLYLRPNSGPFQTPELRAPDLLCNTSLTANEAVIDKYEDDNENSEITPQEVRNGHMALKTITKFFKKVWHSPTVRAELARLAAEAELPCSVLGVQLCRFALIDNEWEIVKQLYDLLEPFFYATNEICKSRHTLVHKVIPYIDLLTDHVDDVDKDSQLAPAVHAAAKCGRTILDKYYSYTDDSIIYHIVMILNPRYKREYFHLRKWPTDPSLRHILPLLARSVDKVRRSICAALYEQWAEDVCLDLQGWAHRIPPIHRAPSSDKPLRGALDFLSIPVASTDAECAFLRGGLTVSKYRHSLTDESIRTSTLLGSWANIPELVPEGNAIAKLKSISQKKDPSASTPSTSAAPQDPGVSASTDSCKVSAAEKGKGKVSAPTGKGTHKSGSSAHGKGVCSVESLFQIDISSAPSRAPNVLALLATSLCTRAHPSPLLASSFSALAHT